MFFVWLSILVRMHFEERDLKRLSPLILLISKSLPNVEKFEGKMTQILVKDGLFERPSLIAPTHYIFFKIL